MKTTDKTFSVTVTPDQHDWRLVAWVDDATDECVRIELRPDRGPDEDESGLISVNLAGRSISHWIALHAGGIFANGKRDLVFTYDGRRKLEVH